MGQRVALGRIVGGALVAVLGGASCGPRTTSQPGTPAARWYGIEVVAGAIRDLPLPDSLPGQSEPTVLIEFPNPPAQDLPVEKDTSVFIGDPPQPADCRVTGNRIVYGPVAHLVFDFPTALSAPRPGFVLSRTTGTSVGPVPLTNPQSLRTGDNFEYHSDLNGVHGCTSRQFLKRLYAMVHVASGQVGHAWGDGFGAAVPWLPDTDASYKGDTRTGVRQVGGSTIYEGTPTEIHWIDGPGKDHVPDPLRAGFAAVYALLLESRTWDGNGQTGRLCLVGQTIVIDLRTGAPVNPQAARQMLNRLVARPGAAPAVAAGLAAAARVLRLPRGLGGYGGQANPEFRQLGCDEF